MKAKNYFIFDAWVMFKRCFTIVVRNPEALLMATITPICLMLLFGTVFSSIADVGNISYVDFIVPGIILQSIGQASQHTATNVTIDMKKGIVDRFQSMSISKFAFLLGHVGAGVVRGIFTAIIIIITSFLIGFRPQSGITNWLLIILSLLLVTITITLIAIMCGTLSKSVEVASGLLFPLFILPFISSGFAPVKTLPTAIRWFASIQPMTPIADSFRALFLDLTVGNSLLVASIWCVSVSILCFSIAVKIYSRRVS